MEREKNRNKELDLENLPRVEDSFDLEDLGIISEKEKMGIDFENLEEELNKTKKGKPIIESSIRKKNYLPIPKYDIVVNLAWRLIEVRTLNNVIAELKSRLSMLESKCKNIDITEEDLINLENTTKVTALQLTQQMRSSDGFRLLPTILETQLHKEIAEAVITIKKDVRTSTEYQIASNIADMEKLDTMYDSLVNDRMTPMDIRVKEMRAIIEQKRRLREQNEKLLGRDKKITVTETNHKNDPIPEARIVDEDDISIIEDIDLKFSTDRR